MSNYVIFIVGLVVTLITGLGVISSTVYVGYKKIPYKNIKETSIKLSNV